jgi:hypothetical protein
MIKPTLACGVEKLRKFREQLERNVQHFAVGVARLVPFAPKADVHPRLPVQRLQKLDSYKFSLSNDLLPLDSCEDRRRLRWHV